jgi:CheY-like chemotaxis protein
MTRKTILFADDDETFLEAMSLRCKTLGPRVQTACDGAQVLAQVALSPPDLMVLDVNMPSGNGLDVAARLLEDPKIPPIPVIFCTGRSDPETIERCKELGAHYVVKGGDTWGSLRPEICRILGINTDVPASGTANAAGSSAAGYVRPKMPRLLFVDDDADLRRAMQIRLRACEVEVVSASNAMQALWMAVNEAPDIIVTDYWMPAGSGEYLLSRLRAVPILREIPVILLTGATDPRKPDFAMERRFRGEFNVSALLYKPVNFDALLDAISPYIKVNIDVWKAASRMRRR